MYLRMHCVCMYTLLDTEPCVAYRCDTMEKVRRQSEALDSEIKEPWKFKEFYQFTFNFAKNPGQKSLGEWDLEKL